MPRLRVLAVALFGVFSALLLAVRAADTPPPASAYEHHLAAARAHAAEQAPALALDAYRAALPLAPDADARRWCQLWILETELQVAPDTLGALGFRLDTLLAPYRTAGRAPDPFWIAAREFKAALADYNGDPDRALTQRLETARFWTQQTPSPDATAGLARAAESLATALQRHSPPDGPTTAGTLDALSFLRDLLEATPPALPPAALASVSLNYARSLQTFGTTGNFDPSLLRSAWERAEAAGRGTPLEKETAAHHLLHKLAAHPVTVSAGLFPTREGAPPLLTLAEAHFRGFFQLSAALDAAAEQLPPHDPARHLASSLKSLRDQLKKPALDLSIPAVLQPDSRVEFELTARHARHADLALHRVSIDAYAELFGDVRDHSAADRLPAASLVHRWRADTGVTETLGRATTRHIWSGPLAPGAYVLVARDPAGSDHQPRVARFLVTRLAAIAAVTPHRDLEVHVFDAATGQPAAAPTALAVQRRERRRASPAGPGQLRLSLEGWKRDWPSSLAVFGEAEGHPFAIRSISEASARSPSTQFHLNTDRRLYEPGETVRWKITARDHTDGRIDLPVARRFAVSATQNFSDEFAAWEITLNRFGSASGELILPPAVRSGTVHLSIRAPGQPTDRALAHVEAFTVSTFRAPEARLELSFPATAADASPRAGGELVFEASATYYTGEPIPGARLFATATFQHSPWPHWAEGTEAVPAPRLAADRESALAPRRLELTTDSRGRARIRIPLHPALPPSAQLHLFAQLVGDGTTATTELTYRLLPGGISAALSVDDAADEVAPADHPPHAFAPAGTSVAVRLTTRDGREEPAAAAGDLVLQRLVWEEIWRAPDGSVLAGAEFETRRRSTASWPPAGEIGWEKLHAAYRTEGIATVAVRTGADGRLRHPLPALPAGYYRLLFRAEGTLPHGENQPHARLDLFVADPTTTRLPVAVTRPLLVPCVASPAPDQPVRLLMILPPGYDRAAVYLSSDVATASRVETFTGNTRLLEFPWHPAFWSGARISVAPLGRDAAFRDLGVVPDRAAHRATVTVDLPAIVRPGATARAKLRATAPDGRPLAAEIALGIADASVAALAATPRPALAETFLAGAAPPGAVFTSAPRPHRIGPPKTSALVSAETPASSLISDRPASYNVSAPSLSFGLASFDLMGANTAAAQVASRLDSFAEPTTRARFTYTAAWQPEVLTDDRGDAELDVTFPDNLTAWQVRADAATADHRFGAATAVIRTSLPLQARLRTPRSLVVGDRVDLLGTLVNATGDAIDARVELSSAAPATLALVEPAPRPATLPAHGETALAWTARALAPGTARLRLDARGPRHADAMEWPVPVRPDGFEQRTGAGGRAAGAPLTLVLDLPTPLDPTRTRVDVQISAGVVPALLDALPYLIDYPYGCTEQTVSRFVPAALAAQLLRELGFSAAEVAARVHPAGAPAPPGRPAAAGLGALDAVIAKSLDRLVAAQLPDGSFPWFPQGAGDPYMTAYVVRALDLAHAARLPFPAALRTDARAALLAGLKHAAVPSPAPLQLAWQLHAALGDPTALAADDRAAAERIFRGLHADRATLPPSAHALLLSGAQALGLAAAAADLRALLEKSAVRTTTREFGATAQWGRHSGYFDGLESAVESTALALAALLATAPQDPLVDAAASWLLLNRSSDRWNNTRDTATAFFALLAYARARGELAPAGGFRLSVNGHPVLARTFDRRALLAPATVTLDAAALVAGSNRLVLEPAAGSSPLFMVAASRAWADADTARASGDFLRVSRRFVRLAETPVLLGPPRLQPEPLDAPGSAVTRNELVECRLVLETSHPIGYLAVESPRPAGCEPANVLSGWDARIAEAGDTSSAPVAFAFPRGDRSVYREEHDDRSVFFLPHLPAGRWELVYRLRAAFAGDFRALPATVTAMYVPALAANGTAARLVVRARGD